MTVPRPLRGQSGDLGQGGDRLLGDYMPDACASLPRSNTSIVVKAALQGENWGL